MTSIGKAYVFSLVDEKNTQVLFNLKSMLTLILTPFLSYLGVSLTYNNFNFS